MFSIQIFVTQFWYVTEDYSVEENTFWTPLLIIITPKPLCSFIKKNFVNVKTLFKDWLFNYFKIIQFLL